MNLRTESKHTLVDLVCQQAASHPDKLAFDYLLDGENQTISITYGDLDRMARSLAVTLQQLDVIGERVLLLYPPSLDYITAFMGCQYAGAIAVPAYPPRRYPTRSVYAALLSNC